MSNILYWKSCIWSVLSLSISGPCTTTGLRIFLIWSKHASYKIAARSAIRCISRATLFASGKASGDVCLTNLFPWISPFNFLSRIIWDNFSSTFSNGSPISLAILWTWKGARELVSFTFGRNFGGIRYRKVRALTKYTDTLSRNFLYFIARTPGLKCAASRRPIFSKRIAVSA